MSSKSLNINYYISGHGFGHATRSAKIIEALLQSDPGTHITVISTAPKHLFPVSTRLVVIPQQVDSPVIQPQPYSIDATTSFTRLRAFLQQAKSLEWQARAAALIQDTKCNLIIADAPSPIAWLGHSNGILSILVSNFSFDGIFAELLRYLPPDDIEEGSVMLSKVVETYATYDYLLRLPGYIDFPFVQHHWSEEDSQRRILDTPLVFRQPRSARETTLEKLHIPKHMYQCKILLVQFGGQLLSSTNSSNTPDIPDGWICLMSSPISGDPRYFQFPPDIYLPDLVSAAHVVLGKFGKTTSFCLIPFRADRKGYGTLSECIGLQKPLVYVRRPMFAEEPGLLKYMQRHGVCKEISVADYEAGNWAKAVAEADDINDRQHRKEILEGSSQVADMVTSIAIQGTALKI